MSYTVEDVCNQSLDAIAWPEVLGDIQDGSHHAQVMLRAYRQCLMQLLRAAPWDFARKSAPLTLLADSTGNTPDVGTVVPLPWLYSYEYPIDCMKVRFIPWNLSNQATNIPADNIQIPSTPLVDGLGQQGLIGLRQRPSKFLIATDFNNMPATQPIPWDVQGVSPQGRTVILSNVREAQAVYTAMMLYPSVWDSLFRAALVAYIAVEVAMPIWAKKDPKFGLIVRNQQAEIVRAKVTEARLVSGNEAGLPTSDIAVDWIQGRFSGGPYMGGIGGGAYWGQSDGLGSYGGGWDSLTVAGAVY